MRLKILFFCFLCVTCVSFAQVTGRLSGSVVDSSESAIPGATVDVLMPGGDDPLLSASTTSSGIFSFIGVRPGTYDVRVTAQGFVVSTLRGVKVDPIRETALPPVRMEVAAVVQTVDVTADAQNIETTNSEVASTVSSSQINKLPVLSRSVQSLVQTQPGVINASPITNATDMVINGLRSTYTNVTLDGINIQDNYLRENGVGYSPNLLRISQVAEMTVATSNANTTVGGGASQVNMVSPSGTNAYHGEGFWYNRNNAFAANDWFNNKDGIEKPFLNQNMFGGNIGGPIFRDRLFFYGAYEGTRARQQSAVNNQVLTPDARNGIFTYLDNTGTVRKVNVLNLAGVGVDPASQELLSQLPTAFNNFRLGDSSANLLRNTAGYSFNQRDNDTIDNLLAKVDYNHSTRHMFTGAFHLTRRVSDRGDAANGYSQIPAVYNDNLVKLFSGTWRWNPTPTLTNELRGGANLAPGIFKTRGELPAFLIVNSSLLFDSPVNEFLPQGRRPSTITIGDTASYIRGRHTAQFGFNIQQVRIESYNNAGIVPEYSVGMGTGQQGLTGAQLPGIGSTDLANANTLLASLGGFVNSYSQTFNITSRNSGFVNGAPYTRNWRYGNYAIFAQDQWKVSSRFTLTLGLRWDYFAPVNEADGLVLMPVVQNNDAVATLLSNATLDFAGSGTGRPIYHGDKKNFAPNVGFAWDVFGDGKTAVRGGYSINYVDDNHIATVNNSALTNGGLQSDVTAAGLSGRLSTGRPQIPTPTFQVPRTVADNYELAPASNAIGLVDPRLRTPYVQQWSFSVERDIKGTLLAVRYVGNHGVQQLRALDYNQVNINAGGFLADFNRARNNGNLARAATGVFNPAYNANIPGSQPLTVFPLLVAGGLLTNATVRTQIDQGQVGNLANIYQTNGLNGALNFYNAPLVLGANLITNFSNSTYHALHVDARHRYRNGMQFQANYVFSKVLSDALGDAQSRFEPFLDFNNARIERARAPYDLTHAFKVNASYELPFGAGRRWLSDHAVLSRIAGGWTIGSILTWQSGAPFSVLSTRGTLNRGGLRSAQNTASTTLTGDQLDNVVGFYMTGDGPYFINPANINPADGRGANQEGRPTFQGQAFFNPDAGNVGNLQRRYFNNPSVFGLNASVQKVVRITERQSAELRLEAVNILNHSTFYTGDSYDGGAPEARFNVNSTSFGRVGYSFFGPRVVQLGLFYRF